MDELCITPTDDSDDNYFTVLFVNKLLIKT
jgi:hypothetical protein